MRFPIFPGRSAPPPEHARNAQFFWHKRLFWLICGFPTLISAFYLFIWATPRYESEAILRVYEAGRDATSPERSTMDGMAGGSIVSPGAYVLKSYISSWDIFQALDLDTLRKGWSKGDILTRFGGFQTFLSKNDMRLWDYYKTHCRGKVDSVSGLITITADGYSADFTHDLLANAVRLSQIELAQSGIKADQAEHELFVKRIQADKLKLAEDIQKIQALQKTPRNSGLYNDYRAIESSIDKSKEETPVLDSKADADAYLAQRGRQIALLKGQLDTMKNDVIHGQTGIAKKSNIYIQFNQLQKLVDEDAQVIFKDDVSLLESEQNSIRHAYYMDFVENPVKPTNATLPHALYWSLGIMLGSFVVYLIVK